MKGNCTSNGVKEMICEVCEHQTREFTPITGEHSYISLGNETFCIYCHKRKPSNSNGAAYSAFTDQGLPWYTENYNQQYTFQWPTIRWDYGNDPCR